jgi:hypothetical protein
MSKITTGLNDRPVDATIAQSGPGLPDDSGIPVEATEEEVLRIRAKLEGLNRKVEDDSPSD